MANETVIKVKVDESGTIQYFDKLGNEMMEAGKASETASQGFSKTQASLVALQAGIGLAAQAFSFAADNIGKVFQVISAGSAVDDTTSAFNDLAISAGVAGDTLLNNLNTALAGTIPNVQLMQQANELLIGGLKPDQIELVASAARTLGEYTGTDAAQGMNALSDSLLKGNDRALKTLGIVVDNNKALKDFADAQGIAVDLLSETAKVEAIRAASLKALAEQQDRFSKATLDGGDRVAQINKVLTDTFNKVQQAVAGDAGVNAALDSFVSTLKGIDYGAISNGFITIANSIIQIANVAAKATSALAGFITGTSAYDRAIGSVTVKSKSFDDRLTSIIDLLGKGTKEATEKALKQYNLLGQEYQSLEKDGKLLQKEIAFLNPEFAKTGQQVAEAAKQYGLLGKETEQVIKPLDKVTTGLIDVIAASKKAEQAADELGKAEKKAAEEAAKAAEEATKAWSDGFDRMIDLKNKFESDIASAKTGGGIFGGIFDSLFGDSTVDSPTGAIEIGRGFGEALTEGLQQGLLAAMNGASGEEMRATVTQGLSQIAQQAFPEAAPFIEFAEPFLIEGIEHMFGGEHAGTTARKAADKFFADAFDADRLFVIIDGQLKQIEDLVFQGETLFGGNSSFTDGSFDNFFQGLPEAAQAAFGGVGLAFEELLGTGEEISGQIGAVLANNIGGSLNNLQLLVQSSGKSFEELRGTVVEAFLDGKVSALEAQTALNGLAQVAQDGIPDAIGATIQAFDNMQAAGSKGGRALIDAFKDIGFEAKELGIKDFGALAQNIIASGKYSTEQVNAYFDELRRQGITNVEQLTAASTEQLLSVGSALQASGYLTEAANETAALIEGINELPSEKTFTLNVKANLDGNAQELANSGVLRELGRLSPQNGGVSVNN